MASSLPPDSEATHSQAESEFSPEWKEFKSRLGDPRYFEDASEAINALRPLFKATITSFDIIRGYQRNQRSVCVRIPYGA